VEPSEYGPFPYVPITQRPKITWPNGARLAVWVIPNIEFFSLKNGLAGHPFEAKGPAPSVRSWAQRDYGNRVGIWRIMKVLTRYGIRASATVNSDICDHHPQIIAEAVKLGWELLGHNRTNTQRLNTVPPEGERALIRHVLDRIGRESGTRPVGWLGAALAESWNTLEHLIDEKCLYVADWVNDDQPYLITVNGKTIVSVPYSYEINDSPHIYYRFGTADEFERMIKRQFDVLYREGEESGRVMAICLHPFMIGVPHRIDSLDRALEHISKHDGVWFATGSEIARHYLDSGATF
jgi:peptidoglycan/xylan/chitin deacetylase (PgdA/CDA1 family)